MNSLKKYILSRMQKIVLLLFVIILIAAGYYAGFYLPVQRRIQAADTTDLEAQIQAVGNAFAIDMLAAKFIQGLPVVGAFGGLSNPVCWKQVMTYVQLKYRKRYIMGKTG